MFLSEETLRIFWKGKREGEGGGGLRIYLIGIEKLRKNIRRINGEKNLIGNFTVNIFQFIIETCEDEIIIVV